MDINVNQITLESINKQLIRFEGTATNVANLNTPGYVGKSTFTTVIDGKTVDQQTYQLTSSANSQTNRSLDVAINGDGFFHLIDGNEHLLTRNGRFHINKDGNLSHSSGALVLGKNGVIPVVAGETEINSEGVVFVAKQQVDQLNIVKPKQTQQIRAEGSNMYSVVNNEFVAVKQLVSQGALNLSTVDASKEMVNMMELSRTIQTSQKVIQAYDQLMNVGINELGKK